MGRGQAGPGAVTYRIAVTKTARTGLQAIPDQRIQQAIRDRIDGLARNPELQGKPLLGELKGYRSLTAEGRRYRIIYRVDRRDVIVLVVFVGLRKEGDRRDVYALAKRLFRLGLLE